MKTAAGIALFLLAVPQGDDAALTRLANRCGGAIPWVYDIASAKDRAAKENKIILAVVRTPYIKAPSDPRSDARPEDPGEAVETLVMATYFTDPDVAALVSARFIPLRIGIQLREQHESAKSRPLPDDPLEPLGLTCDKVKATSLVFASPAGKCLEVLSGVGSFDAEIAYRACRKVLAAHAELSRPRGKTPEEQLAEGDLERAKTGFESKKNLHGQSRVAALSGDPDKALELAKKAGGAAGSLQAGASLIRLGKFEEALQILSSLRQSEAKYRVAWLLDRAGRVEDARKIWTRLCAADPDSPWAWKAAARLEPAAWKVAHLREMEWTGGPKADSFQKIVDAATAYLIGTQHPNGTWRSLDHYGSGPFKFGANAITAIAAEALLRWDTKAPAQAAIARAVDSIDRFLAGAPKQPIHIYDDCYSLSFILERMKRLRDPADMGRAKKHVDRILGYQMEDGRWGYLSNRPHSFDTALAMTRLLQARDAGIAIPADRIQKAATGLAKMRKPDGSFAYWADCSWPSKDKPADGSWMWTVHASAARAALSEHALFLATGKKAGLKAGVELFLKYRAELESPRKNYFGHFDSRGHGAYFYMFAYRHAAEAIRELGAEYGKARDLLRDDLLAIRETDGTWIDQFEYGKPYATGMALVTLSTLEQLK